MLFIIAGFLQHIVVEGGVALEKERELIDHKMRCVSICLIECFRQREVLN